MLFENPTQLIDLAYSSRSNMELYSLLLAIGNFDVNSLTTPEKTKFIASVIGWFENSESSAVHSAAEWLLKRWGQEQRVSDSIQKNYQAWKFDSRSKNEWFVERIGEETFTFVVFPTGSYVIGSVENEEGRGLDEDRRKFVLESALAVCTNPITCLLYTSPSPRDKRQSRMPSSA